MATVNGGAGDDLLSGTAGSDLLLGLDGADTLLGGPANDTLDGARETTPSPRWEALRPRAHRRTTAPTPS